MPMEWLNLIASIISGIAVCIPLVIKLIEYIKKSIQEKNWAMIMQLVLKLMEEAERNYDNGVARKEYVMTSIAALKDSLNCEVDMATISTMIDSVIEATKKINVEPIKEDE
jgi:hypothetical protein